MPDGVVRQSKGLLWAGRVFTGLIVMMLLADGVAKLLQPEPVLKGTLELGFQQSVLVPLGIVLIASTLLYAIPQTSILGAILLTGYLGGAVATHVRAGHPLATHTLFPAYLGILVWLSLVFRDAKLRSILPVRW